MLSRQARSESSRAIYIRRLCAMLLVGGLALCQQGCVAKPPLEDGHLREPDLVELIRIDPSIKLDIRYAAANNLLGRPVYPEARAFLQRPAGEALARASAKLRQEGYGLIVFDGYRPWSVTKLFWDETPPAKRQFVADPKKGSRHNRGCSVDLTLYDMQTGEVVTMPSGYDEFSERAYPDYQGGSNESRRLRDLLREVMESQGFTVYEYEWWHFDYKDWARYPILDLPFSKVGAVRYQDVGKRQADSSTASAVPNPAEVHRAGVTTLRGM